MPPESTTAAPPAPSAPTTATIDAPAPGEKSPSDFMSDIIGDFEQMATEKPPAPRDDKGKFKPAEAPKKTPKKTVEKPPEPKAEESPEPEKTEEPKSETEKPTEGKSYMRTLGEKYDNLKKQVEKEFRPEIQRLKSKLQEYESRKPEDATPLLAKIKSLEEQNSELDKKIQLYKYEESPEYVNKYEKPYAEAWNRALAEFSELEVTEKSPDGVDEMGEPKFKTTTRPATQHDLLKLGALKLGELHSTAKSMFGDAFQTAVDHVKELRRLVAQKQQGIEEAKQKAAEWKSQQAAETQAQSQGLAKAWQEINKTLEERLPKAFKVEEGDEADKAAYTKGFALADLLFMGEPGLTPEQIEALPESFRESVKAKRPMDQTQRVKLHALGRLKMANHDRQLVKLKQLQDRIQELESSLAEYEKSEPDASKAGAGESRATPKDWLEEAQEELKALDK